MTDPGYPYEETDDLRHGPDLHPALLPLLPLVGTWRGTGKGGYPTISEFDYAQEVRFSHDGRPFLFYESRVWIIDEHGQPVRPGAREVGWWRPARRVSIERSEARSELDSRRVSIERSEARSELDSRRVSIEQSEARSELTAGDGEDLEVLLTHPTGIAEIYYGRVTGTRIEMATDAVVRTATAKDVTANKRLYGIVEGDLMYAIDMAAMGHPLTAHLSARLVRIAG